MPCKHKTNLPVRTLVLGALLVLPCAAAGQHGGGGGHVGGGTTGGGGLSGGGGRATGLDVKDDLKTFHAALALQATSQQIVDYKLMAQSTEASMLDLRSLGEEAARRNNASELAVRDKAFGEALEIARTRSKKFLEGLSERQKSGLKEVVKKLTKTDAELTQQARALDDQFEAPREAGPQLTGSVQTLEGTLTGFRRQQTELGQEMSIGEAGDGNGLRISIPPVKNSVRFDNLAITITTAGTISNAGAGAEQGTFKLELTADESELQEHITDVLRAQLEKDDACGERIAIRTAALTPAEPESLLIAHLHYERWACFGQNTMNEMAEGNATLEVKVRLVLGKDGTLRVEPTLGQVEAEGLIGELLRSGSLGETLRDKIAQVIFATVRPSSDGKSILPAAAQGNIALHRAEFADGGSGRLVMVLNGEVQLPSDAIASLTKAPQPGDAKSQLSAQPSGQH